MTTRLKLVKSPHTFKLLPCPFCAGVASHSLGEHGDGSPYPYVECENCGATAEPQNWNKRAFSDGVSEDGKK